MVELYSLEKFFRVYHFTTYTFQPIFNKLYRHAVFIRGFESQMNHTNVKINFWTKASEQPAPSMKDKGILNLVLLI